MYIEFNQHTEVRSRLVVALLIGVVLCSLIPPVSAFLRLQQKPSSKVPSGAYKPGDVIVRFRLNSELARSEFANLLTRDGKSIPSRIERFGGSNLADGLRMMRVPPAETLAVIEALNERPDVEFAEPNYLWQPAAMSNDPHVSSQWPLKNTGQSGGVVGEDLDAETAWELTTGSANVVVAILDGGIDISHPDLQQNIWVNPGETPNNGVDDDQNGFIDDINGWDFYHGDKTVFDNETGDDHATHVAGIVGARGNNGAGVAGVNWQVKMMSVKVLGPDPNQNTVEKVINGCNYVRLLKQAGVNVRVTNNSYGGPSFSVAASLAIQSLNGDGILFVAAAGNDGRDTFNYRQFPADYGLSNIISVAVTDRQGQLATSSNFGGRTVHLGAPGHEILSTLPGATYGSRNGTSTATPHVAGAAALAIAANPSISAVRLRNALLYSGESITSLNGKTVTGKRLNLRRLLDTVTGPPDMTAPAVSANLQVLSFNGRDLTVQWTAPGDDDNTGTAADYDFLFSSTTTGITSSLITAVIPALAGTVQNTTLKIPYRGAAGTLKLRTFDNEGNFSEASVVINGPNNGVIDPYTQTLTPNEALTSGGTPLNLIGDDTFKQVSLPFAFPFFGVNRTSVTVSTNGSLFFSTIPQSSATVGLDTASLIDNLQRQTQIAGLWDNLRTDHRIGGDVFMISDANRVVFRWHAVTFGDGTAPTEFPVNFEIELRSDGRIIMRYGAGNTSLGPVVGISAGEPDPYLASSHTAEFSVLELTNAQTVTFSIGSGNPLPTPTPSPSPSPLPSPSPSPTPLPDPNQIQLIVDEQAPSPGQAVALDAVFAMRDPFLVASNSNFLNPALDPNTRIMIFASNLHAAAGVLEVQLVDFNGQSFTVEAEDVRPVPNFPFTQIVFRLPSGLAPGKCQLKVVTESQNSNVALIRISPPH